MQKEIKISFSRLKLLTIAIALTAIAFIAGSAWTVRKYKDAKLNSTLPGAGEEIPIESRNTEITSDRFYEVIELLLKGTSWSNRTEFESRFSSFPVRELRRSQLPRGCPVLDFEKHSYLIALLRMETITAATAGHFGNVRTPNFPLLTSSEEDIAGEVICWYLVAGFSKHKDETAWWAIFKSE